MLPTMITEFLEYCNTSGFSARSIDTLRSRLDELASFLQKSAIVTPGEIEYRHLQDFVVDFGQPSAHVKKSRVWMSRKFFHFLRVKGSVQTNPAAALVYPKIDKKIPSFLSEAELTRILDYFVTRIETPLGFRNLVIVMLLSCLGLRVSALIGLQTQQVNLQADTIAFDDKGRRRRVMALPESLRKLLESYLTTLPADQEALFVGPRRKRISAHTVQELLRTAETDMGSPVHLHPHLFRHSAATHVNKVADLVVTAEIMGHTRLQNTQHYAHLNPDHYVQYMRQHPFMRIFHQQ